MKPTFFESASRFRGWLGRNHDKVAEVWVGFRKKSSGRASITYPEALDEALCFGWIDGVRKSVDPATYTSRFTPRRPGSYWSMVNIERARKLEAQGRMKPAGLRAFEARDEEKSRSYSYEERTRGLGPPYEKRFRANRKGWAFFEAQPPWYRRTTSWWVMSAKREDTRLRRLATLVELSQKGEWLPGLRRPSRRSAPKP